MKPEQKVASFDDLDNDTKYGESQSLLRDNGKDCIVDNLSDPTTTAKSIWKDTTWRQKSVVLYISIVNYICFLCYGACSPFLARIMLQKGGTVLLSTLVMQTSMVTSAIVALIVGKYQTRVDSKILFVTAQTIFALCQIAFGCTGYIESYWALMGVGTALRAVQGVCQGIFNVAGLTIVCQEFPDFISTVFGIFEAAYGAGYLTGPYVGGILYDWSDGMMAPMAITGIVCLLYAFAGFVVLKKTENQHKYDSNTHIRRILSNPKAVFIICTAGTIIGGFGLCDATITVYLKPEGFSATKVGQLLFLMGVAYTLSALCVGFAIDSRKVLRRFVISLGIIGGLAFPFLWVPNQLEVLIYVAAFGYATCAAITFIPSFDELRYIVDSDGALSSDMSLNSALSGLWSASVSICNFSGSLIGSALEMNFPYYVSLVASLLIGFGFTIVASIISALYMKMTI